MFTDNPSYFSLSGGGTVTSSQASTERVASVNSPGAGPVTSGNGPATGNARSFTAFFRKRPACSNMGTASSASVTSGSTTSTLTHHDSDRSIASSSTATISNEESMPMITRNQSNVTNGQRKSFRSLFRSMSANAENEKTRQILKGDPRPSDVAPPSPYLPHRSHSHSERDRRQRPARRRILKSASELLSNDMVYCGLPGEDTGAIDRNLRANGATNLDNDEDSDSTEVFLGVDDARYYNISAGGPRRHSIGTFLGKDQRGCGSGGSGTTKMTTFSINPARIRVQTTGFIKEPDTIAPPIPTIDQVDSIGAKEKGMKGNRRCRRHRSTIGKGW